ncbi:MAG: sugar porter family MFS transporter [Steroidobacteraceae bacterium]|nr:sugar porter family MFS transporter [Steroidobacteraceae bacterium]
MTPSARYLTTTTLIVALGGFLMGFDVSVVSGIVRFVEAEFELGPLELGWVVSSLSLTAAIGMLASGPMSDRLGRRPVLQIAAVLFAVSAIASAVAPDYLTLVIARMLGGFGVGAALIVAPMYIAEMAPPASRGRFVSFNQLNIVVGISAAFFSNYLILTLGESGAAWTEALRLGEWNWRWMLGIETLPAVAYLLALSLVPESPRWLAMRGRDAEATEVLGRVAGPYAGAVLRDVKESIAAEAQLGRASWRVLLHPSLRLVMTIGIVVGILQQVSGINAVFFYAPMIFERSGIGANAAFMQAALVGLVNLVFTVVAMAVIDRFGRRPLLVFGLSGIAACMLLLAWAFGAGDDANPRLILIAILGFVASFAVSLGPVMWVLFSELFPNRVRGVAISFVGLVNSVTAFLVTLVFPWQLQSLGSATTFLIYGLFALAGLAFVVRVLPETKGRSLEELEAVLVRN